MPPEDAEQYLNRLDGLLAQAGSIIYPPAERAIGKSLAAIQSIVEVYPPQPARDRAKYTDSKGQTRVRLNTYVRGVGHYPRSAFAETAQGILRKKRLPKGIRIRRTSQQMDKRFRLTVMPVEGGVEGELRNDATYSGWVLGPRDQAQTPHQVAFHTETGWKDIDTALEEARPQIDAAMSEAVQEIMAILVK